MAGLGESLSVVVPLHDEECNVRELCDALLPVLESLERPFEVILVDDGSTDGTWEHLSAIAKHEERVKPLRLRRNYGQTAAMMAGIEAACGDYLIAMDGDLQNDPADIPLLIAKLESGYDVVSGWRRERHDAFFTRVLPSRLANRLISVITGLRLHDFGCSLKIYRRDVIEDVKLYGEMHRFIPIYAHWQGGTVAEVPVRHHPRRRGRSKYGLARVYKVLLDLFLIRFLDRYATKPIYIFGAFGFANFAIATLAFGYGLYLRIAQDIWFVRTPIPLIMVLTFITGFTSILMGLLAEMIMRTYYESQDKRSYVVQSRLNFD